MSNIYILVLAYNYSQITILRLVLMFLKNYINFSKSGMTSNFSFLYITMYFDVGNRSISLNNFRLSEALGIL